LEKKFFEEKKIICVIKKYQDFNKIIKIKDVKEEDVLLPIFLTLETLTRGGDITLDILNARPLCKEKLMSVYLGKSKIYTLPYWKCIQYDNMVIKVDRTIDDIPLSENLKTRNPERYLLNKLDTTDLFAIASISREKNYKINISKKYQNIKYMILTLKKNLVQNKNNKKNSLP